MYEKAVYLEDDEDVDAGQDDPGDGDLGLNIDKQRLVGHRQWHHLVVLQEGLDGDNDGITASSTGSKNRKCCLLHWITTDKKNPFFDAVNSLVHNICC